MDETEIEIEIDNAVATRLLEIALRLAISSLARAFTTRVPVIDAFT
jgi:hypothetical protein